MNLGPPLSRCAQVSPTATRLPLKPSNGEDRPPCRRIYQKHKTRRQPLPDAGVLSIEGALAGDGFHAKSLCA